jgi:hypothetical protein
VKRFIGDTFDDFKILFFTPGRSQAKQHKNTRGRKKRKDPRGPTTDLVVGRIVLRPQMATNEDPETANNAS